MLGTPCTGMAKSWPIPLAQAVAEPAAGEGEQRCPNAWVSIVGISPMRAPHRQDWALTGPGLDCDCASGHTEFAPSPLMTNAKQPSCNLNARVAYSRRPCNSVLRLPGKAHRKQMANGINNLRVAPHPQKCLYKRLTRLRLTIGRRDAVYHERCSGRIRRGDDLASAPVRRATQLAQSHRDWSRGFLACSSRS